MLAALNLQRVEDNALHLVNSAEQRNTSTQPVRLRSRHGRQAGQTNWRLQDRIFTQIFGRSSLGASSEVVGLVLNRMLSEEFRRAEGPRVRENILATAFAHA